MASRTCRCGASIESDVCPYCDSPTTYRMGLEMFEIPGTVPVHIPDHPVRSDFEKMLVGFVPSVMLMVALVAVHTYYLGPAPVGLSILCVLIGVTMPWCIGDCILWWYDHWGEDYDTYGGLC